MKTNIGNPWGVLISALALFFILGPSTSSGYAAGAGIVISELMWDGTEYIELTNTSDSEISVAGWTLTRQQSGGEEKVVVTLSAGAKISAHEYFLIEKNEAATEITGDVLSSSLTLVNTGERVRLKDDASTVVDEVNQLGSWFAGKDTTEGVAMERTDVNVSGTEESNWHSATETVGGRMGTPRQANSLVPKNEAPIASISVATDEVGVGELVSFSGEDSVDPEGNTLTYSWDFGDGSSGSGSTTTHAFSEAGSKTIMLTVSDGELTDTASVVLTVTAVSYSDQVVINEFLPDPTGSDTDNEFIELLNLGSVPVSLSGWKLDDGDGGSTPYTIPVGTSIAPGGYLSFTRAATGLALNNDGDSVRLLAPDGSVKASTSYSDSTEGLSWNRVEGKGYQESTILTAGAKNVITQPSPEAGRLLEDEEEEGDFSTEVVVNELLPNPTGSDTENEFVELFNKGSASVNLAGWKLDDEDGGSGAYALPSGTSIGAGKFLALLRPQTKLALNNDSDSVRLFDPAGKEISTFTYEESVGEGVAWARDNQGKYQLTTTVTQGKTNVITAPSSAEASAGKAGQVAGATVTTVALKDVRNLKTGAMVTTEGVVSAPPGVLGKGILYLAGSGIQVYFSEDEYPELKVGDKVKVTGELVSYLGESRLKLAGVSDVVKVSVVEEPLPHEARTGDVGEILEGFLVVVIGRVTETSGDTFYVDDGSGAVKIFIKEDTGIDKPKMKKGDLVTIIGVVSQTNSGYRILPRFQEDVRLGAVAGLRTFPKTGISEQGALPTRALVLVLVALWLPAFTWRSTVAT